MKKEIIKRKLEKIIEKNLHNVADCCELDSLSAIKEIIILFQQQIKRRIKI